MHLKIHIVVTCISMFNFIQTKIMCPIYIYIYTYALILKFFISKNIIT